MNGIKKTVLFLFIVSAFLLVGTGVSASTACANGQTYGNFTKNCYMNQCSVQESCSVQTYTVQKGDSLCKIASNCGTTVNNLKSLNCLNGNCIYPGQVLCTTGNCASDSICTTGDCASSNTCATGNCANGNYIFYSYFCF